MSCRVALCKSIKRVKQTEEYESEPEKPEKMNEDAFDPFSVDDAMDQDVSFATVTTKSSQNNSVDKNKDSSFINFGRQFDESFDASPKRNSVPTSVKRNINASVDSDIFSELFKSNDTSDLNKHNVVSPNTSFNSSINSSMSLTPTKESLNFSHQSPHQPKLDQSSPRSALSKSTLGQDDRNMKSKLPVFLNFRETMSCVYDDSNSSSLTEIQGTIDLIPNKFIQNQTFFLSVKDSKNHIGDITSYLDFAREISTISRDLDPFAEEQLNRGCRVFQVDMPENVASLNAKPIQILKFSASEFLRPIPLLVNCKVRVGGNHCRVGIKVRSNPTNKMNIENVTILMAVPPDVNGESMKMSLQGGVWDPMRRVVIWSSPLVKSGETIEFQLQFDYTSVNDQLPRFPVLVRCDSTNDKLSDVEIGVGGETYFDASGATHRQPGRTPFKMNLSTSYRLFHRKI